MQRPPVYFHFPEGPVSFSKRNKLKGVLVKLFKAEGRPLQRLDYVFCSDSYLLKMNQKWLQHDSYTDIITFDLSEKNAGIVGEIYISIDRVRENAISFKTRFNDELRRVVFHGALHLCGYKDKSQAQQSKMRRSETQWLRLFSRST